MRVAIVTDTYYPATDGVIRFVENLAMQLSELGHTIDIVFPQFPQRYYPGRPAPIPGVNFVPLKCLSLQLKGYFLTLPTNGMLKSILQADIIIINALATAGLYAIELAFRVNKPLALFIHHDEDDIILKTMTIPSFAKTILRILARKYYTKFITYGVATNKFYQKALHFGADPEKIFWVSFGVPEVHVTDEEVAFMREKLGADPEDRILLYLGRLSSEKNIETILTALGKLGEHRHVKCYIAGIGYLAEHLHKRIMEEHLSVTMLGKIPEEHLFQLYKTADLLVTPSFHESMCFTVVESMSQSTPAVINAAFHEPDLRADNSVLIENIFDVDEIVNKIQDLLADSIKLEQLQNNAFVTSKKFRWGNFGKIWEKELYKAITLHRS